MSLDQVPAKVMGFRIAKCAGKHASLVEHDRDLVQRLIAQLEPRNHFHADRIDLLRTLVGP